MKTISQDKFDGGAAHSAPPDEARYAGMLQILAIVSFFVLLCGISLAFAVHRTGIVLIDIRKPAEQKRLFLPVPVMLLKAGMLFIPEQERQEIRRTLHPTHEAAEAFFDEINAIPDVTFVEVEKPGEVFRLAKKNGHLLLNVRSDRDQIDVRFPVHAAEELWRELSR